MKTAIIYTSVHHGNTKKIIDEIAKTNEVDLIDATQVTEKDLSGYDLIGFASGGCGMVSCEPDFGKKTSAPGFASSMLLNPCPYCAAKVSSGWVL